ncbi:DUF2533 family protein [Bacillus massilinigeriensis]|uniref:DUF2533 family protein n=1 Tax=Bacillus mediterraneensis TaxID=1805474 RepID=UPI0008F947EA|nr:DUF2533 family protein [Bacillus mediterraneensis]
MDVHKALAQHAKKQNEKYNRFLELDQMREKYISEAVSLCKDGKLFSTDNINRVTAEINNIGLRFTPERKFVTKEMVEEYTARLL